MPHLDPDDLALLALGDQSLTGTDADHLAGCAECADELATLRHLVEVGGETEELRALPAPPDRVWAAIAAQTIDAAPPAPAAPPRAPAAQPAGPAGPAGKPSGGTGPGRPTSAARRQRRAGGLLRLALVALVGAILGVGATLGVQALRGGGSSSSGTVVASGAFAPKAPAAQSATGSATVVDTGHGRELHIAVAGMPAPQGFYEAWLYDPASGGMLALGALGTGGGVFDITGRDLSAYTVVDISAQSFDGTEGHGQSMLQAPLA